MKRPVLTLLLACALAVVFGAGDSARADSLLLNTVDGGQAMTTRSADSAILTYIEVGAKNVSISSFGTFGEITQAGNIEGLIFDATSGNTPVLVSQTAPVAAVDSGSAAWYTVSDHFTLLANHEYYMGIMSDQRFKYQYEYPGVSPVALANSANGLTAPLGNNGNARGTLASPFFSTYGGVQQSIEIFGPNASAVPEPSSVALLGLGVIGLAVAGYRRRQTAAI